MVWYEKPNFVSGKVVPFRPSRAEPSRRAKAARKADLLGNQPKRDDRPRIGLNAQKLTAIVD